MQFRDGVWYATEKFDASNKCLTYEFYTDSDGEYMVEQRSVEDKLNKLSIDNKFIYKGRLTAPYSSEPANMIVKFQLSK